MTSSLFQLPEMPEVPNQGLLGAHYERCELTQGLAYREDSFANGRLEFRWNAGAANYWYVPARSYLRMRFQLEYNNEAANVLNARWLALNDYQASDSFVQRFLANQDCAYQYTRCVILETAFMESKSIQATLASFYGTAVTNEARVKLGFDKIGFRPIGPSALLTFPGHVARTGDGVVVAEENGFDWLQNRVPTAEVVNVAIQELMLVTTLFAEGKLWGIWRKNAANQAQVSVGSLFEDTAAAPNPTILPDFSNVHVGSLFSVNKPGGHEGNNDAAKRENFGYLPLHVERLNTLNDGGHARNLALLNDAFSVSAYLKQKTLQAIAPAHACASHLFSAASLTYGGQVVSAINQHMALIDAYDKRINQTNPYFERYGPGNLSNFYSPHFADRAALVGEDGWVEICWQPPLAFFRFPHAIPSGDFRLNLAIASKWKENAFQVVGATAYKHEILSEFNGHREDYHVKNLSLVMYNYFVQGPSTDTARFVLDLENIAVQSQQMTSGNQTTQFDVSEHSTSIAIAHGDLTDGPWRQGRSLFRFAPRKPSTELVLFPQADVVPRYWSTFQLLFDGRQWPQQLADPIVAENGGSALYQDSKDFPLLQLYLDHAAHTGLLYSPAGPEDYKLWEAQGLLLHTAWPRSNSNATRVQLQERFKQHTAWVGNSTIDVLIFTKFRKGFIINIQNQRVVRVDTPQNNTDGATTG